jgi:hypothetical protein
MADEVDLPIDKEEAALAYGVRVASLPDEVVYLESGPRRVTRSPSAARSCPNIPA